MMPVLFTIGPFNVYSFGFFLFGAFVFSTFIIWRLGKEELKEEEYIDAYLLTNIFMLISARAVYIFTHQSVFGLNILKYILVRETPGLSIIGGLFGGFIFLYWYTRRKKIAFLHMADIFSLGGSFALGLAKIGEMLGGAGFGRETAQFWGIRVIGKIGKYHPVELYEALCIFILATLLYKFYRNLTKSKWPSGLIFYSFSIGTAIIIFLLEFMKAYPVYLYGLSIRQYIAFIIILVSGIALYLKIKFIRKVKI